ncbi:MAG: serine protease Do [Verrucomicrobiales bacterium]|jgi:serine protease Do
MADDVATVPAIEGLEEQPQSLRKRIAKAVDAVYPALVRVEVVSELSSQGRMRKVRGSGSGAIITNEGHVLTNHHVAGKATRIICRLSNREEIDAELIGTDILSDLAILKLDLSSRKEVTPLPVAKLGDSSKVTVGDTVLAMGSPAGLSQSVTMGIVSNTEMIPPQSSRFDLDGENVGELVRWIGHDAVIYPGNSGGPLVDINGEIIGVNEVGIGSLGGAIPANLAERVAGEIIEHGEVRRSWVGINAQPLLKNMQGERGVLVGGVVDDSPAATAGIQAGDVITRFAGTEVDAFSSEDIPLFNAVVFECQIGDDVAVEGRRASEKIKWTVKTDTREGSVGQPRELKNWGMTARDFTRMSALVHRRKDKNGVQVESILAGGPVKEAKPALKRHDVIVKLGDKAITDIEDLKKETISLLGGKDEPQPVLVTFDRDGEEVLTVVKVGPEEPRSKPKRSDKAWLGVDTQVLSRDLAEVLEIKGKKGVRITRVHSGTTAEKAELKVGDVIFKLDGQVINASRPEDDSIFANLIRQYDTDSEVELSIHRGGKNETLLVDLQSRPLASEELDEYEDADFEFTARELAFQDKVEKRLSDDARGVLLSKVEGSGWAELAGLSTGDILLTVADKPVSGLDDLKSIMAEIRKEKPRQVVFFVRRGIHTGYRELEPNWES